MPQYFNVVLSKRQHEIVEMALRGLSAGDEESERENEETLRAFLNTTEKVV